MYSVNVAEIFINSLPNFWEGVFYPVKIAMPYLLPLFIAYIAWNIVKYFVKRITYTISILEGHTHRQSTRRAKRAADVVDIISATNDLKGYTKK